MKILAILSSACLIISSSFTSPSPQSLKEALTFYVSFDGMVNANYAPGNPYAYTAKNYDQLPDGKRGLRSKFIKLAENRGVSGDALEFTQKNDNILYYEGKYNMPYQLENWSGTVSFWMQIDPDKDLEPGYCDPIQITDEGYNDAALWVDFSDKNPRAFRMGVYADLNAWNPDGTEGADNPEFVKRLVPSKDMPFGRDRWTHVVIRYENLNSDKGSAQLYLNGELHGTQENIHEPFGWDLERATIRLGLSYVGLLDELAIFNKALSEEEIAEIYSMQGNLKSILQP
jgi:hypothetical protein